MSRALLSVAVTERFELSKGYPLHTFQACSFGHSDTSPKSISINVLIFRSKAK